MNYSNVVKDQPIGIYTMTGEYIEIFNKQTHTLRFRINEIKIACRDFGGIVGNLRFIYIIDGFIPDRIPPQPSPFDEYLSTSTIEGDKFESTKVFDGFSASFRQWRAESHCNFSHGYGLYFKVWFEGQLDDKSWTVDFGSFKRNGIKHQLTYWFDHSTIVAIDDPHLDWFIEANRRKILDLRLVKSVGCEKYAELVFNIIDNIIQQETSQRCRVRQVEVFEHDKNSAIYKRV